MPRWLRPNPSASPLLLVDPAEDAGVSAKQFYALSKKVAPLFEFIDPPHGTWARIGDFEALTRHHLLVELPGPSVVPKQPPGAVIRFPRALSGPFRSWRFLDWADFPVGLARKLSSGYECVEGQLERWLAGMWFTLTVQRGTIYETVEDWNTVVFRLVRLALMHAQALATAQESEFDIWDWLCDIALALPLHWEGVPGFPGQIEGDGQTEEMFAQPLAELLDQNDPELNKLGLHYYEHFDCYEEIKVRNLRRVIEPLREKEKWLFHGNPDPMPPDLTYEDFSAAHDIGYLIGPCRPREKREPSPEVGGTKDHSNTLDGKMPTTHPPVSMKDIISPDAKMRVRQSGADFTGPFRKRRSTYPHGYDFDDLLEED